MIIGTRRCVYTTDVLHDLAESMGLRGYYPRDRRITSCPKTRLYLIILLFLLHQQFYRDLSVYAISQLTWQTVLAHFFNVRLCTRLKSLAAFCTRFFEYLHDQFFMSLQVTACNCCTATNPPFKQSHQAKSNRSSTNRLLSMSAANRR